MKTKNIEFKLILLISFLSFISCELNDDKDLPDPVYSSPTIDIEDGSTLGLIVGQSILYPDINIVGDVGISNFKVTVENSVELEEIYDGSSGRIETSFEFEVPEEWLDTTRTIVFEVKDTLDNTTTVTVNVAVGTLIPEYDIENIELNGQAFKRLTGYINVNETLSNSSLWIIADSVTVAPQVKLTITQGTQIFAENENTLLFVEEAAEVDWQGTATEPIVFNSLANAPGQGPGDDTRGQWTGIRINGAGSDTNSGIIRYVRQMYAGFGSSTNTFHFDDVGSGTTVEYIQVYKNDNRGIRIDDGALNLRYVVSTNSADRGVRMDEGWSGAGQFWIVNKDIAASNGIEGRQGTPVLSNITITGIGFHVPGETPDGGGIRIRDGGNAQIYNTVVTGVDRSIRYSGGSEQGVANGESFFRDSASFNNADDGGTGFHQSAGFFNPTSDDYEPMFNNSVEPFEITDGYVGISTLNSSPAGAIHPFFIDVNYIGAVEPGNDWTVGWCLNLDGTLRQ